ncbi:MAG: hypothetical protein K5920_03120 [Bacteroidales bacterium]|nr:hypothetical protein [Bacteroidales bacterium]
MIIKKKEVCCLCGKELQGCGYRYDQWGNKCCLAHVTSTCESCGKLVRRGQRFCPACRRSQVSATDKLRPQFVYSEVKSRLSSIGMNLPTETVDISITDRTELNRLATYKSDQLTGLTISAGTPFGMRHSIYLLDEMPTSRYKETLAHECGHVWLNDRFSILNRQSIQEVEGFCNLVAYKVLLFDHTKEAEIARESMLSNPDPIYGEGFRIMKRRAEQMGWNRMLASYS